MKDLFGVCQPPANETLKNNTTATQEVLPADTLVWTTYPVNTTEYVEGGSMTAIIKLPQDYNATIGALFYVNGSLVASGGGLVPEPPLPNVGLTVGVNVVFDSNVTAGSQVSLAIWSPEPISVWTNTSSPPTYASSLVSIPSSPSTLPPTSSATPLPYAPDFCGYSH